jgi:hypothetical protein
LSRTKAVILRVQQGALLEERQRRIERAEAAEADSISHSTAGEPVPRD